MIRTRTLVGVSVLAASVVCAAVLVFSDAQSSAQDTGHHLPAIVQTHQRVLLVPSTQVDLGWCVTITPGVGNCGEAHGGNPGILVERWVALSRTVAVDAVITSGAVKTVTIAHSAPLPTVGGHGLPDGLRGAVVDVYYRRLPRDVHFPAMHFKGFNVRGRPVRRRVSYGRLELQLPTRPWHSPERAPCELFTTPIHKLYGPTDSNVVEEFKSYPGFIGHAFLTCASAAYSLRGTRNYRPLFVGVLVDAAHPGERPGPLPGMKPLSGHPGIFSFLTGEGPSVGRRIPHAWLVATDATAPHKTRFRERLTVLEHAHAVVHARER